METKPLLIPLQREHKNGHPDDMQYNGVLPALKWMVFWRQYDGSITANFFVREHKARDFAQEQSLREYLREVNGS